MTPLLLIGVQSLGLKLEEALARARGLLLEDGTSAIRVLLAQAATLLLGVAAAASPAPPPDPPLQLCLARLALR